MKWKQKLSEVGLTEETISHGLKNKIRAYYDILEGINEAKDTIANPTLNDDVDAIKDDLVDLQEALEDADRNLVKAIELYDKNKERYAELSKHLSKGRPRKDGKPSQPKATETQKVVETPKATETPKLNVQTPITPTEEVKDEKKKSGGWGLFVAALAVVTLGAGALLFKNRD